MPQCACGEGLGSSLWKSGLFFTKWVLRTEFRGSGLTGAPLTEPPYWLAVVAFLDVVLPSPPPHFLTLKC